MSGNKSNKTGKKRPKSYYKKCANVKRMRLNQLGVGMKGFIISCEREKEATREIYNLLNEYSDQLYGPDKCSNSEDQAIHKNEGEDDSDRSENDDIEKAMKQEVDAFKETKHVERRFQRLDSKAKNCIFIKTTVEKPSEVTDKIFQNFIETGIKKARYVMRLLPVDGTCKAVVEDILKLGKDLFEQYFATPLGEGYTFSITFKARNNNSVARDDLIPALSCIVTELNPAHQVQHTDPEVVISVQIVCTICCISILRNFSKFKKYNLQEIVKTSSKTDLKDSSVTDPSEENKDNSSTSNDNNGTGNSNENKDTGTSEENKNTISTDKEIKDTDITTSSNENKVNSSTNEENNDNIVTKD